MPRDKLRRGVSGWLLYIVCAGVLIVGGYYLGPWNLIVGMIGQGAALVVSLLIIFGVAWLFIVAPGQLKVWWREHPLLRWQLDQWKRRFLR